MSIVCSNIFLDKEIKKPKKPNSQAFKIIHEEAYQ